MKLSSSELSPARVTAEERLLHVDPRPGTLTDHLLEELDRKSVV